MSVDKEEELVKFWMLSASRSGSGNLLNESLTLRDRAFPHDLAHISEETD